MELEAHLPALQVIVPLLAAPLVAVLQPRGLAWAAAAATALFTLAISIALTIQVLSGNTIDYAMGGWEAPYGIALSVDAFSAILLLVISGSAVFALLPGKASVDGQVEEPRQPLFYSAWLLALSGLIGIVVSADAFNIFVFMEISSLASYLLIAGGPDRRALPAVFKYLIMGTIGATFYLIGVGLIYMMTGTLNLADMEARITDVGDLKPVLVAAGFITLGLALKAAIFPLHVWLPNAYTHSPHMVTVFLAGCGTKVAIYVLVRFDFLVFQGHLEGHTAQFTLFILPLAVMGILVASSVAMFEGNLKRRLAVSSIAQICYILLGASLVSAAGLAAGLVHIFNHALAKAGLFLSIACLAMHHSDLSLDSLRGAARQMPVTGAALVVCGMSLIGIPGTAGFISKWMLIVAVLEVPVFGPWLVLVVVISSLMALAYVWRIIETLYFQYDEDSKEIAEQPRKEAPTFMLVAACVLAALNIVFGLMPGLPTELAAEATQVLMGSAK